MGNFKTNYNSYKRPRVCKFAICNKNNFLEYVKCQFEPSTSYIREFIIFLRLPPNSSVRFFVFKNAFILKQNE